MAISIRKTPGGVIAGFSGMIAGVQQSREFYESVKQAIAEDPESRSVILDFSSATFLPDSLLIGRMMQLSKENRLAGLKTYVIPGSNFDIKELFTFIMLEKVIPFISHEDEIKP